MTVSMTGHHALQALKPLEVASYLRVQGWRQEADLNGKGSLWLLGPGNGRDEADVTLPLRRDLGDFELRMSEVVRTLGRVERRPEAEILQDLLTTSSDLIRVRAPSREAESGSLPLEQAVAFVERSRDLVLAAACAAVSKRASYPTRKPVKATDYLSRVRMGQTERGSYVLTILSPVAPVLVRSPNYRSATTCPILSSASDARACRGPGRPRAGRASGGGVRRHGRIPASGATRRLRQPLRRRGRPRGGQPGRRARGNA